MVRCSRADEENCNTDCYHHDPHDPHGESCNCGCCSKLICTEPDFCVEVGKRVMCVVSPICLKDGENA